ncbi:MAG: DNA sulfur modification protein DndE [Candidatus Competibacteraceae bacterium]|nr:MAG: DNA sulfur modification protein DndE [Candidatus Competibacteraceae bacterium]
MKPPIETVRVSTKGRETLIKIKKNTGLEHWNEVCRIALCLSLADPSIPQKPEKIGDRSIDMEWKTFVGSFHEEFAAVIALKGHKEGIDLSKKETLSEYLRSHLERGISRLKNTKNISTLGNFLWNLSSREVDMKLPIDS